MNWRVLLFLVFSPLQPAIAQEEVIETQDTEEHNKQESDEESYFIQGNTKIWLDRNVSIQSKNHLKVLPAVDSTNQSALSSAITSELTSIIKNKLKKSGLIILEEDQEPPPDGIVIKPFITKYEQGSAVGRWVSPGIGATVCIIRATIVDPHSNEVLGEIISWRHVFTGGLFSAGVDEEVPVAAAKAVSNALINQITSIP